MWKNEHYLVDDLNSFVKENCSDLIAPFAITNEYLLSIDPNRNWGSYRIENETISVKLPFTMFDVVEHFKRALRADFSDKFPIVVLCTPPTTTGKTMHILDGMHRILHAAMCNQPTISAYTINEDVLNEFKIKYRPVFNTKVLVPEVGKESLDGLQFDWYK